jgi:hypothetical protein
VGVGVGRLQTDIERESGERDIERESGVVMCRLKLLNLISFLFILSICKILVGGILVILKNLIEKANTS